MIANVIWPAEPGRLLAVMEPKSGAGNVLMMVGALAVITLAVFIWAAFFRKPPRRKHHSHHRQARPAPDAHEPDTSESDSSDRKHSRSRRRRRHKERRLNPTLAKTGGLPGVRSDGQAPPGSSN